jgi:excisionase family DNA binding protein
MDFRPEAVTGEASPVAQEDRALSITEAAKRANLSKRTLWRLISDGTIKSVRASTRRRIIMTSELARHLRQGVAA